MVFHKSKFSEDVIANVIDQAFITDLFSKMNLFAIYYFNRAFLVFYTFIKV